MTPAESPARPGTRPGGRRLVPSPEADVARCFVAVFPPPPVVEALVALRNRVEPDLPGLRWTRPGNLHFTLRFFGNLARGERETAARVLDGIVPGRPVFSLELLGLGVFPAWRRPRVLWIGAGSGSAPLVDLARSLDRGFEEAGLGQADKPFAPHLTLARWPGPGSGRVPEAAVSWSTLRIPDSFPVIEVRLMESELGPRGPVYRMLHAAPLGTQGSA